MAILKVHNGTSFVPAIGKVHDGVAFSGKMKFHDGVGFVDLFPLVVNMSTLDINNTNTVSTARAGLRFQSDGTEDGTLPNGTFLVDDRGNWLVSGNASDVWIERILNVGTLNWLDPGAGRKQMTVDRSYGVQDLVNLGGAVTATVTFNAYDAASGGNLLNSVQIVFTANTVII